MFVLGIESSCDDTSAAVLENGSCVCRMLYQIKNTTHSKYGGVVPELAVDVISNQFIMLLTTLINQSSVGLKQIDLIAVTVGPGSCSSLLVVLIQSKR